MKISIELASGGCAQLKRVASRHKNRLSFQTTQQPIGATVWLLTRCALPYMGQQGRLALAPPTGAPNVNDMIASPLAAAPKVSPQSLADQEAHALKTGSLSVELLFAGSDEFHSKYAQAWPRSPLNSPVASMSPHSNPIRITTSVSKSTGVIDASDKAKPQIRAGVPASMGQVDSMSPHSNPVRITTSIPKSTGVIDASDKAKPQIRAGVPAPMGPVIRAPSNPPSSVNSTLGMPPQDPKHPLMEHAEAIFLAIAAGGLMTSAVIGAGLVSAPATRSTITCSALLGVYFAYSAFKQATGRD